MVNPSPNDPNWTGILRVRHAFAPNMSKIEDQGFVSDGDDWSFFSVNLYMPADLIGRFHII